MRMLAAVTAIVFGLFVSACDPMKPAPGTDAPVDTTARDAALSSAVTILSGTLLAFEANGDLPEGGRDLIVATFKYGTAACEIVEDETLTVAERQARLAVDLIDERLVWDSMVLALVGDLDTEKRLYLTPLIEGVRVAARAALATRADVLDFSRSCAIVKRLDQTFSLGTPAPVPAPRPLAPMASVEERTGYPDGWAMASVEERTGDKVWLTSTESMIGS